MGANTKTDANNADKRKRELPKILSIYKNSEFAVQQKARFLFYLCISLIGCLLVMIFYTGYIEIISSFYSRLYLPVIIPEIAILLIISICLLLVIKGFIDLSAHLLVVSTQITLWFVIWIDKGDNIVHLDSIVFILAILSMLPILISKRQNTIFLYVIFNILMLFIFLIVNTEELNVSKSAAIDYFADNTIAFIFVGIVAYSIYSINKRALAQAIEDTKERILAEEKLKESDEGYRHMFEKNPQPMLIYDLETLAILEVNYAAVEHYGYSKDEFLSFSLKDIRPAEDIPKFLSAINQINSAYSSRGISRHLKKNGELIYVDISAHSITYKGRKSRHILINDFTERIEAELALAKSEKKFHEMTDLLPQVVFEADLNGVLTYANKKGFEQYGFSEQEFQNGINIFSTICEADRVRAAENIQLTLNSLPLQENQYTALRRDGSTFPIQIFSDVVKENERAIGFRGIIIDSSERIISEEKLKQSEQFRRRVFDSSKIPIIIMDAFTYQFIDINAAGINIYGFNSHEEAIGKTPIDVSAPIQYDGTPSPQKAKLYIEQALVNGSVTFEWLHLRKNGKLWDAEVHLLSFQSNNKTLLQFSLIDITERKKAVKELIESEVKYRTLFENAQIGIYQTTPDGKILTANPALLNMLGFESIKELEKRNLETENIYIDSIRDDFKKLIERDGFVENFESNWLCKNGEVINIIENASAVRSINGKTLYYDGFVENITERKKNERNLKESEEKYRTLMENMNEVVMVVDNDDRVQFVNNKFSEILGYAKEDIIGYIGYEKLIEPREHDVIKNSNNQRKKRIASQYELSFIAKDGRKIDFIVNGAPIEDSKGEIIGSIGTMMDITEKKIIERELEQYRNNLEKLVKKRTEELEASNEELISTNEELYRQRKELETAMFKLKDAQTKLVQSEKMASLGVLAAGVAHEINNPLNFIAGGIAGIETYFNEYLKEHINEVTPLIEGINVGVKRAADIVLSLNHYSRKDDLPSTDCNVHEIIDNCLVMLYNKIRNRIEVKKEYNAKPFHILCNEGRLHQVFLNIIANSTQAIDDMGTISIFTRTNVNIIVVTISDTGCGIEPEILPKITDPFFTTKDPGKGTGLGLSITYNIIKEYNGTLEFESQIGKGTKAIITLPNNKV